MSEESTIIEVGGTLEYLVALDGEGKVVRCEGPMVSAKAENAQVPFIGRCTLDGHTMKRIPTRRRIDVKFRPPKELAYSVVPVVGEALP